MTPNEYQATVAKRAAPITREVQNRAYKPEIYSALVKALFDYQHVAQILDGYKKHIFYGKPLPEYCNPRFFGAATSVKDVPPILNLEMLHAVLGISTEGAELVEHLNCAKQFDKDVVKEIGDVAWYVALAGLANASSLEDILIENDKKLEARFQGGFSEQKAQTHDGK